MSSPSPAALGVPIHTSRASVQFHLPVFFAGPKFSVFNPTFLFFLSAEIPFNLLENEKIV
jgi:hypothetical protein